MTYFSSIRIALLLLMAALAAPLTAQPQGSYSDGEQSSPSTGETSGYSDTAQNPPSSGDTSSYSNDDNSDPDGTKKKGDVNHDGSITMADANMVVNYFLASDKSTINGIYTDAADVNGDGQITMADANMIVNMFLGMGNQ